jgi:hypothetical protein
MRAGMTESAVLGSPSAPDVQALRLGQPGPLGVQPITPRRARGMEPTIGPAPETDTSVLTGGQPPAGPPPAISPAGSARIQQLTETYKQSLIRNGMPADSVNEAVQTFNDALLKSGKIK